MDTNSITTVEVDDLTVGDVAQVYTTDAEGLAVALVETVTRVTKYAVWFGPCDYTSPVLDRGLGLTTSLYS